MRPPDKPKAKYKCTNCKRDYITTSVNSTKNKCPFFLKNTLIAKLVKGD